MKNRATTLFPALASLCLTLAAQAGPIVVPDGDTYLVPPGDSIVTTDVIVNGTFRNQGEVTHTGLFQNFGFTDNAGLFTNLGEFRSTSALRNTGTFNNDGIFVNDAISLFESNGIFNSSGHMESRWIAEFAELNVSGTLDNYDDLSTRSNATHHMTGVVTNDGQWGNAGHLLIGQAGTAGTLFVNNGELFNFDLLEVTADATLINTGTLTNQEDLLIDGSLINEGVLLNEGTWIINEGGAPGSADIVNTGSIVNNRNLTVNRAALTIEGEWIDQSTMNLNVDTVTVTGALRNYSNILRVTGDVEVAEGGTLEQRGLWLDIEGNLVNRGDAFANLSTMSAANIENYGNITVDALLSTENFVQHDGITTVLYQLLAANVQIHGGLLVGGAYASIAGDRFGPDTVVEIFAGTLDAGPERLNIAGDLVLYDDATTAFTLRDNAGTTQTGDLAVTADIILAGTLIVNLDPAATIEAGDWWRLAWGATISGMFDEILLPTVAGIDFELSIFQFGPPGVGFQELRLQAVQAVPIPAPLILLLSATTLLLRRRRP